MARRRAREPDLQALAEAAYAQVCALLNDWDVVARPKQRPPPGDWSTWLLLAGRGFGKTRTGAEWTRQRVDGGARHIGIAGPTADDIRDAMIEGESGLLAVYKHKPKRERPRYEASKRRVTFSTGARALLISADEPDRFRNKQYDTVWADELAAWRYRDAWDQLQFGLRLGDPKACVTTTPRPTKLIKELIAEAKASNPSVVVTHGTTYENSANLAQKFVDKIVRKYEGTRLGRQELEALILEDVPGALWLRDELDAHRVREAPELDRIVVSLDPSVAADGGGDECGIVAVGVGLCTCKGKAERHGFLLADKSDNLSPNAWALRAVGLFKDQSADRVVAEVNNGGGLVEVNIRTADAKIPYEAVHAARGKRVRAEPISSLYEQGKIHHVGAFAKLEDELTTWDASSGAPSPNRLDALVWGFSSLMLEGTSVASLAGIPRSGLGSRRM